MKTEREIAELIFQLFRNTNCKENEGYMINVLKNQVVYNLNPKEKELFDVVYIGLQTLRYITVDKDGNFIRLAKKGFDYIYDDEKVKKMNSIPWIIPEYKKTDWVKAYYKLWKIIGPQDSATHYISGPNFYKFITNLCDDLTPNYYDYIEDRKKKNLSTSRISHYQDLINHIDESNRYELYMNIQINFEDSVLEYEKIDSDFSSDIESVFESDINPVVSNIKNNENEYHPKVFISYSWDNEKHTEWVMKLATELMEKGIEVILDKWEMNFGKLLPHFMEQSILQSDRVICIMTPNYKKKTEKLSGGVGYEYSIMSAEVLKNIQTNKFIPLLREGDEIPSFLNGRNYIDMRDNASYDNKLEDLIRDIWKEPKNKKPKIGEKPKFE